MNSAKPGETLPFQTCSTVTASLCTQACFSCRGCLCFPCACQSRKPSKARCSQESSAKAARERKREEERKERGTQKVIARVAAVLSWDLLERPFEGFSWYLSDLAERASKRGATNANNATLQQQLILLLLYYDTALSHLYTISTDALPIRHLYTIQRCRTYIRYSTVALIYYTALLVIRIANK